MQLMILSSRMRRHRFWVHEILRKRKEHGVFCHLVKELQLDADRHHEYFRMSAEKLEFVLSFVGPVIAKTTVAREPIEPKQKLAICLRLVHWISTTLD